jgi:hypothetical protein
VAAFLSGVPVRGALPRAALQASLGVLAWGTMRLAAGRARVEAVVCGILAAAAVGGPVAAYFWAEFFVEAGDGWFMAVPVMAAAHAARGFVGAGFWWAVGVFAGAGVAAGAWSFVSREGS